MTFFEAKEKLVETTKQLTDSSCKVVEDYGTLGERILKSGNKEYLRFQAVEWYGRNPQLDLRWWSETGFAGKGVTFNEDQARLLYQILKGLIEGKEGE